MTLSKINLCLLLLCLFTNWASSGGTAAPTNAKKPTLSKEPMKQAPVSNKRQGVRIVYLDEMAVAQIQVHPHGTVLTFPIKPEVHVGRKDAFDIVYVKNDLVISARMPGAVTNIFVYLLGRRFSIKLIASESNGDEIVAIRDPQDASMQVEVK